MAHRILASLRLSHTHDTIVRDSFARGISGSERKRISLAEVLAVNAAVTSWDNPIRRLDSSSAVDSLKLLRDMSQTAGMTNVVTLYQTSEAMYQYFDRVLLMDERHMIFCDPTSRAKQYFLDLRFHCAERQTTPISSLRSPPLLSGTF